MNATAKKFLLFLFLIFALASTYRLIGELTLERSKQISLLTPLDEKIPFIPELTVVYASIYFMWLPFVFAPNVSAAYFKGIVWTTFWAFGILYIFYYLCPSSYPRPDLGDCDCLRHMPLKWLYGVDLPNNTFPSSHSAGVAILLCAGKEKLGGMSKWLYFIWGALILVSTFTIKQHYLGDMLSGVAVGYAVWFVKKGYSMNPETS